MRTAKLDSLFRIKPGERVRLRSHDSDWSDNPDFTRLRKDALKRKARDFIKQNIQELAESQEALWAADTHAVLIVLQAMDAAGKDGVIRHCMSGLNPQGCQVHAFKKPTPEELDHTFLWRSMRALPSRGSIGIFNRSYYEDVLVVKVHPELLGPMRPTTAGAAAFWNGRYDDINSFERHLTRNRTLILKFFLNISKEEQKRRFLDRLKTPDKRWKFSLTDVAERAHWDAYQRAYETMLSRTTTAWAPWYVVPADNKWVTRAIVASVVTSSIRSLRLHPPEPTQDQLRALRVAERRLARE